MKMDKCKICETVICEECQKTKPEDEDPQSDNPIEVFNFCHNCNKETDFHEAYKTEEKEKLISLSQVHSCLKFAKNDLTKYCDSQQKEDALNKMPMKFNISKNFNYFELKEHFDYGCVYSNFCTKCLVFFEDKNSLVNHLMKDCVHQEIRCRDCHKNMTRKDFKEESHTCSANRTWSEKLKIKAARTIED